MLPVVWSGHMAWTIIGVAYSKTCTDMSSFFKWAEILYDFWYNQLPLSSNKELTLSSPSGLEVS